MPQFIYTAKDIDGKTQSGQAEALDEMVLAERLQAEGLFIVSIKELTNINVNSQPKVSLSDSSKYTHNNITLEDLVVLSRQLATMLDAGVNLLRCLNIISGQISSKRLAEIVVALRQDVEQGKPLSVALSRHPKVFTQFWVSLAEVGEASGTMPAVLNKLANHMQQQAHFRAMITGAMIYPMILMFICVGAIFFFALVVAPQFENVFKQMNAKLPPVTIFVLSTFQFLKLNFIYVGMGIAMFVYLFRSWKRTPSGRLIYEQSMLKLPVVGEIRLLILVERFTSQMSILTDAGVPILNALEITERMMDSIVGSTVVSNIREGVRGGRPFADCMEEQAFFPSMAVQMVKVGEETGELGKMFNHVSAFYQRKVEAFMKSFGTIIEPFMLVFMASIIGLIVVSMFMPLFKLGQGRGV